MNTVATRPSWPTSPCRSCGSPLVWARSPSTGRLSPIDAEPSTGGNCLLIDRGAREPHVAVLSRAGILQVLEVDEYAEFRLNHFVTCAFAATHRKTS